MFESYKTIFEQRGELYHQAMSQYPLARKQEFEHILQVAGLQGGWTVGDIPSGGGYLQGFLSDQVKDQVKILAVETAEAFIRKHSSSALTVVMTPDLCQIPLVDQSLDALISLAGLHHLNSRAKFYQEMYRLLCPQGVLAIADVLAHSGVARFLNEFVHQHSSMGHQGDFLSHQEISTLEALLFQVTLAQPICYAWVFPDVAAMIQFCRMLFGIDQASDRQILEGIQHYLGYTFVGTECWMNWELYFLRAIKPS